MRRCNDRNLRLFGKIDLDHNKYIMNMINYFLENGMILNDRYLMYNYESYRKCVLDFKIRLKKEVNNSVFVIDDILNIICDYI